MKRGLILCLVVLGTLIGFSVTTGSASAADTPVTLAPGETVRIPIRLWCLDFGKPFPTAIAGPVSRPPDAAFLALQAALARGATESDPYQTQLAIWRAADGTFHDVAGVGYVLAQQIYSDSLKLTVSPVPTNTLEFAVSQGSVKVTFENFKPISDTVHSELLPYTGTADLVVLNTSSESVTFIPVDGMVFNAGQRHERADLDLASGRADRTHHLAHYRRDHPTEMPGCHLCSCWCWGPRYFALACGYARARQEYRPERVRVSEGRGFSGVNC